MKNVLAALAPLAVCACFGSGANNVGNSDTYPLIRVDGRAVPTSIGDAGASIQVTHGTLSTHSWTVTCDYKVDFSNGKSISGSKDCSLIGDARSVPDGVQLLLDASEAGGPLGAHYYDFQTNTGKPCSCGLLCAGGPCASDRAVDSIRTSRSDPFARREF